MVALVVVVAELLAVTMDGGVPGVMDVFNGMEELYRMLPTSHEGILFCSLRAKRF